MTEIIKAEPVDLSKEALPSELHLYAWIEDPRGDFNHKGIVYQDPHFKVVYVFSKKNFGKPFTMKQVNGFIEEAQVIFSKKEYENITVQELKFFRKPF